MSETITRGIRIEVETTYVEERSSPAEDYYFFSYHITISNEGDETVRLISRRWIITDSDGNVEKVEGAGVVGEQPRLRPGQGFEYTSFCPLKTPLGTMHGSYQMVTDAGDTFDAEIAPFTLALPHSVN